MGILAPVIKAPSLDSKNLITGAISLVIAFLFCGWAAAVISTSLLGKSIKKDKRFSYPAFGTFTVRNRKARKGRNPQTGAEIKIKASRTVGFKPAPTLKSSL